MVGIQEILAVAEAGFRQLGVGEEVDVEVTLGGAVERPGDNTESGNLLDRGDNRVILLVVRAGGATARDVEAEGGVVPEVDAATAVGVDGILADGVFRAGGDGDAEPFEAERAPLLVTTFPAPVLVPPIVFDEPSVMKTPPSPLPLLND